MSSFNPHFFDANQYLKSLKLKKVYTSLIISVQTKKGDILAKTKNDKIGHFKPRKKDKHK